MNALTRSARFALPRANNAMANGARAQTQTRMGSNMAYFKKHWTGDAGTYPVIVTVTFACLVCTGRCFHSLTCQDVRITPTARQTLIRPHD
mmetsp:Transcript_12123/g.15375  ORF Transcript_12123/g.15375 Transcript_12123/m.15375 type:complete len:91 (-) Transcript_12123:196-468(-)|eukprot:CAMPEP_0203673058 /NCGR_PEP_ID=MMETSP0090-20130426/10773_1 /ASSEMBLY_ACC=CAM_ASM_001088 /TAXON_ID=426623 /ORGANISM="Chaetoceros affinis, Strain CCMP159" /LENGTH=90 /DNA_ID=CAMNT_0050538593 /DNA_START=52 /DNA_END=324 /DNA_ORIENTATION=+